MEEGKVDDLHILYEVLALLKRLDAEALPRIIGMINSYFGHEITGLKGVPERATSRMVTTSVEATIDGDFSKDRSMSAKEFMLQKRPRTDVERIACLAYYLTHFQGLGEFQTKDLSLANTEAAQPKLSNPSVSVAHAVRARYVISTTKNYWKLSFLGELFVRALPDYEAAKLAVADATTGRKPKRSVSKRRNQNNPEKKAK